MKRPLRIGLVQMDADLGDVGANLERALGYVREAREKEVDLLCFPKLFSTGYNPALLGQRYHSLAEPVSGPTIRRLAQAAQENGIHIIAPGYLFFVIEGQSFIVYCSIQAGSYRQRRVRKWH